MLNHHKNPHHTFMYVWLVGAVVVLVAGMWAYATEHPRSVPVEPLVEEPASVPEVPVPVSTRTLSLGERGEFDGVAVTIDRVLEDSRCPQSVQCIQAGTVRVSSTVVSGTGTSTLVLKLGETSTTETHTVTLVSAEPYPKTPGAIEQSQYRFTVRVEKR